MFTSSPVRGLRPMPVSAALREHANLRSSMRWLRPFRSSAIQKPFDGLLGLTRLTPALQASQRIHNVQFNQAVPPLQTWCKALVHSDVVAAPWQMLEAARRVVKT